MAELNQATEECCTAADQAACCEPSAKAACCGQDDAHCGCAGAQANAGVNDVREEVRSRYAAAATHLAGGATGCCSPSDSFDAGDDAFGAALYDPSDGAEVPDTARLASLGCGNPTAVAELHEGETVLDLARANAVKAGVENVEFHRGFIEDIPLIDESVDVVISNCVINLSGDKPRVLREAARVLRPGGRLAVSDVIADEDMDDDTRADMQRWTGCIAGALTRSEFETALTDAGFIDVEIHESHRVHDQAASAIVRARKPTAHTT